MNKLSIAISVLAIFIGVASIILTVYNQNESERLDALRDFRRDFSRTFVGRDGRTIWTMSSIKIRDEPNDPGPPIYQRR